MDVLGLVDIPSWLLVCLLPVLVTLLYTWNRRGLFNRLGIKTKPNTFLVGDFVQMAKQGLQIYGPKTVNEYGKVFGTFWGNVPFLVISDTDMVKQIAVKQFSSFSERFRFKSKPKGLNTAVSIAEGQHWRYLRSTLSPSFTTGKVKRMGRGIDSSLETFHSNILEQTRQHPDGFDLAPMLTAYTLDVIFKTGFGVDVDSQNNADSSFVKNAREVNRFSFAKHPAILFNFLFPDFPGLDKIQMQMTPKGPTDFFREVMKTLSEERKKSNAAHTDLLQTMINAHKEDADDDGSMDRSTQTVEEMKRKGLTDEEILGNSLIFMIAGFDTTASTLAWLTYDLAVNTKCQETLIKEIDNDLGQEPPSYDTVFKMQYLDQVVCECLRCHPIATAMSRQATEDTEVCGVPIPKDMGVIFSAFALHFMPEYWEDPEEFKPERFAPENKDKVNEYAYIPFGIGPRNCIGMRLALLEVKMTIVSLLQKYRIAKTDKLKVPMEGSTQGILRPKHPVFVRLEKR